MVLLVPSLVAYALSCLLPLVFINKDIKIIRRLSLGLILLASVVLTILALKTIISDQPLNAVLLQITPDTGFSVILDRLSALFVFIISIVAVSFALYSFSYVEHTGSSTRKNIEVGISGLFILSMVLFVASGNMFSQLLFWELMSLTSFFLVMFDYDNKETQKSGLFYFIMTQMSTLFLMFAFILINNITGSFDLQPLSEISPVMQAVIFLSLFIGFGIKAGVMPFHKWLPYAHSASPSNVSALMSGVMLKVAIYGLVRYVIFVLSPDLWWGVMILVFGVISALLGVIYALKEHDIKRLLAYHSIENIGIILIGIGLYLIFQENGLPELAFLSLAAALFHTLNHALFKSLLFMAAGSVVTAMGTRNIEKMGGLIKKMPYTAVLFLTGAVAISALPPLNGFVSELMIFQAFFQTFSLSSPSLIILLFIGLSLFALTSALAAACFVKAFGIIFLATPRSEEATNAHEVSLGMIIGPAILAALCIIFGAGSYQIFTYMGYRPPLPDMLVISLILIGFLAVFLLVMRLAANRRERISDTWACGLPAINCRMEYTASGFSDPILTIFKWIYRTNKAVRRDYWDKQSSVPKGGYAEVHTFNFFEGRLYLPVVRLVQRISKYVSDKHNADLDTLILYSFVAIIILLLIIGWLL
jgi:formate hydrogenlyase subunit 3/multisubunit Na+/H+ antiporter MnhD subunit